MKNLLKLLTIPFVCFTLFICSFSVHAEEWEGYRRNVTVDHNPGKVGYERWTGTGWSWSYDEAYCQNPINITYDVTYNYKEAYKMIDEINKERVKAGVPELKINDRLMADAMARAAEARLFFSHTRPDGSNCRARSMFIRGENIYSGSDNAVDANCSLVNSPPHYATMTYEEYTYVGVGCVGSTWVQIYAGQDEWHKYYEVDGYPDKPIDLETLPLTYKSNYSETVTTAINPDWIQKIYLDVYGVNRDCQYGATYAEEYNSFYIGDCLDIEIKLRTYCNPEIVKSSSQVVNMTNPDEYVITNLTPDICKIDNDKVTLKKEGTAEFKVSLLADSSVSYTLKLNVYGSEEKQEDSDVEEDGLVKKGVRYIYGDMSYKVTSVKNRTVTCEGRFLSNKKKLTIPNTIKLYGKTYKVTGIAKQAFKDDDLLTQITIGKNVSTIGKEAFKNCKKLKTITIKSTKLKSVGKNALKNIHKKAKIKVPKSKLSKYKKLFKSKGQKKTVKIKK